MEFLVVFFSSYGYIAVFTILLICGFGLPIPEDVTLVSAGIISGLGYANPHIMLLVSMCGVLVGDSIMFLSGQYFGVSIIRKRSVKKILTRARLKAVREQFKKYGNRLIFIARFLPGLRAAVFLLSGVMKKVSLPKFIMIDFFAGIISVPIWIYLGHYGASNLDWLKRQILLGKYITFIALGVLLFIIFIVYLKKKFLKI